MVQDFRMVFFLVFFICGTVAAELIPEPALVPPIRRLIRTPQVSCALDQEALKCWGTPPSGLSLPLRQLPEAREIFDFLISPTGEYIAILVIDPASSEVDHVVEYGFNDSFPNSHRYLLRVKQPRSLTWKYPALNIYCVEGTDEENHALKVCAGPNVFNPIVDYDRTQATSPSFQACQLNLQLKIRAAPEGTCRNVQGFEGEDFDDSGPLQRQLVDLGIAHNPASLATLNLERSNWQECKWWNGRWQPMSWHSLSLLSFSTPVDARFNGLSPFWPWDSHAPSGAVEHRFLDGRAIFASERVGSAAWKPEDIVKEVLPELECRKFPNRKLLTLVPRQLLAESFRSDSNSEVPAFRQLLKEELGITNFEIAPARSTVSFFNRSKNRSVEVQLDRSNPNPYERLPLRMFEKIKSYGPFFVVSDGTYRIYTSDWKEIPALSQAPLKSHRRQFKINGIGYSCVGLTCYQIVD